MTASTRRELRSAATSTSTTAIGLIRALTDARPIKPTSTRCLSARRPSLGRGSTYRRGNSVQTTAATSKLSETIVVHGNAPHDRPGFLVSHLIGNRASFLGTKAPMPRVPEPNFLHGITLHGLPAMRKRRVRGRWQALPRIPMRQMLLRLCEEYVSAA